VPQNKWFRSFVRFLPTILTVTAAIVDGANNDSVDANNQPDSSDFIPDLNDGSDLNIVTIEETNIIQVDHTSVQGLFTSEEWSNIMRESE
jgi:hypothetical protein